MSGYYGKQCHLTRVNEEKPDVEDTERKTVTAITSTTSLNDCPFLGQEQPPGTVDFIQSGIRVDWLKFCFYHGSLIHCPIFT